MIEFKDLSKDVQDHALDKLLRKHFPGYYESSVICELNDYLETKDIDDNRARLIIAMGLMCKRLDIWMKDNPQIKLDDAIVMITECVLDYPRDR